MKVIVVGGAGYVGCELTKLLLKNDYKVTVYDLFIYGDNLKEHQNLTKIKGDIRDKKLLEKIVTNCDVLIHLACISNDPSFDLDPELGKSINFDPFEHLVKISKDNGVKKFIYASSSSVYGIKDDENVNETFSLKPLTDYSKFKAMCEEILLKYNDKNFNCCIIRPATCCGYSDRQRLDLVVNILTNHGYNNKLIKVFGGSQMRPNINIKDMCNSYLHVMRSLEKNINGQVFNVGFENMPVIEIAKLVKKVLGGDINILQEKSNDLRSYHISSAKIEKILNFKNEFNIEDAILDLKNAFDNNLLIDSMSNKNYFNIHKMKHLNLK